MIDEAIKNRVLPAAIAAGKQVSVGFLVFSESFRWIEFSAAVGAAFASGLALAAQLGLPASESKWVGIFGAVVGGLCYIRKPTTSHNTDSLTTVGNRGDSLTSAALADSPSAAVADSGAGAAPAPTVVE